MVGLLNTHTARRIATAAAYGGGGISLLSFSLYGLLRLQARVARQTITGVPLSDPPNPDGVYGSYRGDPISFVVVGDSCAAGYGVSIPEETPGGLLAAGLSEIAERPVRLTTVAKGGARSADLAGQVDIALESSPDVAMIIIGGNDVTNKVPPAKAVGMLIEAVRRLRDAGCGTVVGTCPDLGTIKPIQPPLRWLARRWSRQLAAAQTFAVADAGGRTVSLGSLLGPEFAASPDELFSEDQFHPSSAGYAHAAAAMLPSLASTLGLWTEDDDEALLTPGANATVDDTRSRQPGADVVPISTVLRDAMAHPGTPDPTATTVNGAEVDGADVTGADVTGAEVTGGVLDGSEVDDGRADDGQIDGRETNTSRRFWPRLRDRRPRVAAEEPAVATDSITDRTGDHKDGLKPV